jgi:hypothetical protein
MRGKKSYNIRNVEAHLDVNISKLDQQTNFPNQNNMPVYLLNRNMQFQRNNHNQYNIIDQQQQINEYINSKFGASKYASHLVSGKMFKKI